MKTKTILPQCLVLFLLPLLLWSCSDTEDTTAPTSAPIKWQLSVLTQGASPSINTDATDWEDYVESLTLAGVYTGTVTVSGSSATYDVPRFFGKRNLFFAANLIATDQPRIGRYDAFAINDASRQRAAEEAFNFAEFKTAPYIRPSLADADRRYIPMVATLSGVRIDTTAAGLETLSTDQLQLRRIFASVDITINIDVSAFPSMAAATTCPIDIINIPAYFSLGGVIQDYNVTHTASTDYITQHYELPFESASGTERTYKARVYLPEHAVVKPIFSENKLNSMTAVKLKLSEGSTFYGRIATSEDPRRSSTGTTTRSNFGKIVRNHNYELILRVKSSYANPAVQGSEPSTFYLN